MELVFLPILWRYALTLHFLETLQPQQVRDGKVEMLKHGLIHSVQHTQDVLSNPVTKPPSGEIVLDSVQYKTPLCTG